MARRAALLLIASSEVVSKWRYYVSFRFVQIHKDGKIRMNSEHASSNSKGSGGSSLLAELAGEATNKLRVLQTETQDKQARTQRLHDALVKIFQFLNTFSGHVNNIAPTIPRTYNLDPQTAYTSLKWQNAGADYRKQDLSDSALMDHVSFLLRLTAAGPVTVTRRWNQLDTLKNELHVFGLRALDDLDMLVRSKSQQEVFLARLAPDFQIKIKFHGDYKEGLIDMQCNNLDGFGASSFKLNPETVTSELLDDFGCFLIGRTDTLPSQMINAICVGPRR